MAESVEGARGGASVWWVLGVGVSGAVSCVLPLVAVDVWLGPDEPGRGFIGGLLLGLGLLCLTVLVLPAARGIRRSRPGGWGWVLLVMLVGDFGAMLLLGRLVAFTPGLMSCLVFASPALLLAVVAASRSRPARITAGAALLAVYALAVPVQHVQRELAVEAWVDATGAPSRTLVQIIPRGLLIGPYTWKHQVMTAVFGQVSGDDLPSAVEQIRPGYGTPCGALEYATEGGLVWETVPVCVQEAPGLWFRGFSDRGGVGFVLQRDGLTISYTESGLGYIAASQAASPVGTRERDHVRRVITAARPATDSELWEALNWAQAPPVSWLLR
jgi:hypothetical protein